VTSKLKNRTALMEERVASLEERLKAELSNRTTLVEKGALEHDGVRKSQSRKRKKSCSLLSEIGRVRSNWSQLLRDQGVGFALAERTTLTQAAMVRKDTPSGILGPMVDGEGEDEEEHVKAKDQADGVLLDRLLRHVGFADGRGSTNAVSYNSMRLSMQADQSFTDQEKKQADTLYGIDITAWTEDGVNLRTLTRQLKVILKDSEMRTERVQTRRGKKNESSWRLTPI
jgi:hypothetical protein